MNERRSKMRKREKLLAKKQENKQKSLFDKPLRLQLFKLLKGASVDDFIVRRIEVEDSEDVETLILHKSQVVGISEEGFEFYTVDDQGVLIDEAILELPVKSSAYKNWYEDISEQVLEAYDKKVKEECLLSAIRNVDEEYGRKLYKHLGLKVLAVVEKQGILEDEGSVDVIEDDDGDFGGVETDEGGISISDSAADLINARNATKAKQSIEVSEIEEASAVEFSTTPASTEENIVEPVQTTIVEEEDDWDETE